MGSGQDFQDLIDRLAAAATDAREAVREAHAARKDLARVVREAKATVEGLVVAEWDALVEEALTTSLSNLRDTLEKTQKAKADQIIAAFDTLSNTILYGKKGRGTFIAPPGHPFEGAFRKAEAAMKAPPEGEG